MRRIAEQVRESGAHRQQLSAGFEFHLEGAAKRTMNRIDGADVKGATPGRHTCSLDGRWRSRCRGCHVQRQGQTGQGELRFRIADLMRFFCESRQLLRVGRDWVSLTPIFTEAITLRDGDNADSCWQCIYLDANNDDLKVSNVTHGLPGQPDTGSSQEGPWSLAVLACGGRVHPAAHHRCRSVEVQRN